jgi:hypothetical protein
LRQDNGETTSDGTLRHTARSLGVNLMQRIAIWIFYAVGALAIGYLALYAYAAFTGRDLQPGDPIHIFRKPDAPNYSAATDAGFG